MARTTAELIGEVTEVDSTISLTPFIDIANELVTELCLTSGYTDSRLQKIETWLAAHFYHTRDPQTTSESVSGVSEAKQLFTGDGLKNTQWGQVVLILDTKGNFSKLAGKIQQGKGPGRISVGALITNTERTSITRRGY